MENEVIESQEGQVVESNDNAEVSNEITFDKILEIAPEGIKELYSKNGIDSFEKLEKRTEWLEKTVGKKGIIPPEDDASDEDKQKFRDEMYNRLGRPENGEYEFEVPEGISDEYISQEFLDGLAQKAYQNGMTNDGFQEMINHIYDAYKETISSIEAVKAQIKEMQAEGSMDDQSESVTDTKDTIREKAKNMAIEANQEHAKGNFAKAKQLKADADALYNKLAQMH